MEPPPIVEVFYEEKGNFGNNLHVNIDRQQAHFTLYLDLLPSLNQGMYSCFSFFSRFMLMFSALMRLLHASLSDEDPF